jgi:hypothetical protein
VRLHFFLRISNIQISHEQLNNLSFEFFLNLLQKEMNSDEQFKENLSKSVIIELSYENKLIQP